MRVDIRDRSRFYQLCLFYVSLFGLWLLSERTGDLGDSRPLVTVLQAIRTGIELLAAFYVMATLLKCLDYLVARQVPFGSPRPAPFPDARIGILYLCCDDLDDRAFESLCRLRHDGPLELVVHDDSRAGAECHEALRTRVTALARRHHMPITVLQRPRREGGKPGAVNYVLARFRDRFDFLLFCDNDSTSLDSDCLGRALHRFRDPSVAAVQFRSKGLHDPEDPPLRRTLARAIDVFDLFASHQDRHGMMPFLGHNALVRMSCLLSAGGLTPGFLSDDIDVSVRWYLAGLRVVYAPDVEFGERAPGSFSSFRLRARKWAFGCVQVFRRHALRVILSRRLPLSARLGFAEFVGFYLVQALLVIYLVDAYILLPLVSDGPPGTFQLHPPLAVAGAVVAAAILMPTFSFCLRRGRLAEWPLLGWTCCLVYGSTALETCRGILRGIFRGSLEWVPTNAARRDRTLPLRCWLEFGFGVALFVVPLAHRPDLLALPVSYLFISNSLFSPLILACYASPSGHGRSQERLRAAAVRALVISLLLTLAACAVVAPALAAEVTVRGSQVLVEGRPFLLKGIHYSPWLPGTGPAKSHPWPPRETVERDLDAIRATGANAILVYDDAPVEIFPMAGRRGLLVIQAFYLNWQSILDDAYMDARTREILERVERARDEESLLAWSLGNEVTEWVLETHGPDALAGRIASVAAAVRTADPLHPITHSNWPVTKDLLLPFLDVVSFNVYPFWPREVVVRGYEHYLSDVLRPLARGRPFWVTEFGTNTLESTPEQQARLLRDCWRAIERQTEGGIVFSFADEWWKNYDNPIEKGKFWERAHAPDDEESHDLDPEEHYGIVDSQRRPKPAYHVVALMYADRPSIPRYAWFAAPLVALMLYTVYVFTRRA